MKVKHELQRRKSQKNQADVEPEKQSKTSRKKLKPVIMIERLKAEAKAEVEAQEKDKEEVLENFPPKRAKKDTTTEEDKIQPGRQSKVNPPEEPKAKKEVLENTAPKRSARGKMEASVSPNPKEAESQPEPRSS